MTTKKQNLLKAGALAQGWIETINELQQRSDAWHKGAYASSVAELYALLAACLDFYLSIKSDDLSNLAMTQLLKQNNLPVTGGTSLPLKIVRLVMFSNSLRKSGDVARETSYANAIYVAAKAGITGSNFAAFADTNGGVDGMRRSAVKQSNNVSSNTPDKTELREIATRRFDKLQKVLSEEIVIDAALKPDEGSYTLALLKLTDSDKGVIVYACKSKALLDTVLAEAGQDFDKEDTEEAKRDLREKRARDATNKRDELSEKMAVHVNIPIAPAPAVTLLSMPHAHIA